MTEVNVGSVKFCALAAGEGDGDGAVRIVGRGIDTDAVGGVCRGSETGEQHPAGESRCKDLLHMCPPLSIAQVELGVCHYRNCIAFSHRVGGVGGAT